MPPGAAEQLLLACLAERAWLMGLLPRAQPWDVWDDSLLLHYMQRMPALQPLPIMGLFYRWGVDLAGPFPATTRGNSYIMFCIEHFSKHVELIPLPSKESKHTASAFKARVLCRYGAMAEVVTDSGGEFEGEFAQLLESALVDHRRASPGHPQSDGLAERAVQSVKRALRRRCLDTKIGSDWDEDLPWVMLGYNCSTQAASGFSPYVLLHAQQPTEAAP
jgi:hypothetical protein